MWGDIMLDRQQRPIIKTERLRLRPPDAGDVEDLVRLVNDLDIARMTTGIPYPYTLDHGCAFIAMVEAADPAHDLPLLIEHERYGPMGMVGLHRRTRAWPEIGYWLGREFWGLGFATEAAKALVDFATQSRGHRVLASGHFADNPASGRVLEKLGFLYTGEVIARASYGRDESALTRMMVRLA